MNLFLNLPAPAANAAGAAVDVSAFGKSKTIVVAGSWTLTPNITIEVNNDVAQSGPWTGITTLQGGGLVTIDVACRWMRARVSSFKGGQAPGVNVAGNDGGTSFAALPAPADNGVAAAVDVSALDLYKTMQVGGAFKGTAIVEASEDGGVTWGTVCSFQTPGLQSIVVGADFMRVRRVGVPVIAPGLPIVNIGATSASGGGAAGVVTDGVTITGDGTAGSPLAVDPAGISGDVAIVTDATLTGTGTTGSPLHVVAAAAVGGSQVSLVNGEVAPVVIGTVVYSSAAGTFKNARANLAATSRVIGLAVAAIANGVAGLVQVNGVFTMTAAEWDAIAGTAGGLAFDTPYYLDAATFGKLTAVAPVTIGQSVVAVIVGLSPTQAVLAPQPPILL